jgi:MMP 1-O-methyltransferase
MALAARTRAAHDELARLHGALADVEGWLTDEEAEVLFELAKRCTGRGVITEIGSWKGRSTIALALGSQAGRGVPVYAVDRPRGAIFETFQRNVEKAGVGNVVRPINSSSEEAVHEIDEPIEVLFIDASHKYPEVKRDFDLWVPKVLDGGVVAMHDTTWFAGPKKVAEDEIYRSRHFRKVRFIFSSTTIGEKVAANTAKDRVRSRYALAAKRLFEAAATVKERIPKPLERLGRKALRLLQ